MKQKINFLLITMLFALCLSACGKQPVDQTDVTADTETLSEAEGPETDKTEKEDTAPEQTAAESAEGFDMERIRKSIIIKGQPFELPTALCDLGEGWTWKEHENSHFAPDGEGLVTIYYNGEEWFVGSVENYDEGAEEQGIIYNLSIKTDDCSIDQLEPNKTTRQDVIDRYGEADSYEENSSENIYGNINSATGRALKKEQCLAIVYDENDVVMRVTINYYININEKN